MEEHFHRFWQVKPKRKGSNPKDKAREKFIRHVANGTDPLKIISAAQQWATHEKENGKDGTEFVPMAVTWLNQTRFNDYQFKTAEEVAAMPNRMRSCGKWWIWSGEKEKWEPETI